MGLSDPLFADCPETERILYQVPREHVHFFCYLFDCYENLAILTTIDKVESIVQIATTPSCRRDVEDLLSALEGEIPIRRVVGDR